jgi:hypothetical protein
VRGDTARHATLAGLGRQHTICLPHHRQPRPHAPVHVSQSVGDVPTNGFGLPRAQPIAYNQGKPAHTHTHNTRTHNTTGCTPRPLPRPVTRHMCAAPTALYVQLHTLRVVKAVKTASYANVQQPAGASSVCSWACAQPAHCFQVVHVQTATHSLPVLFARWRERSPCLSCLRGGGNCGGSCQAVIAPGDMLRTRWWRRVACSVPVSSSPFGCCAVL